MEQMQQVCVVEVTVKYPAGHSSRYIYNRTDVYCPHCGKQEVFCESGDGDYYAGPSHVCLGCGNDFTWSSGSRDDSKQIVDQINAAVAKGE